MITEATCDECQNVFTIKLKTKTRGINIKETYFRCPNCKKKYTAYVMDNKCRKTQREIRKLMESKQIPADKFVNKELTEEEYTAEIGRIDAEIKEKQAILKQKMNGLKKALT